VQLTLYTAGVENFVVNLSLLQFSSYLFQVVFRTHLEFLAMTFKETENDLNGTYETLWM